MNPPRSAPSPSVPSSSLQSSAYALAHLRASIETGDPGRVAEALAAVPEWVSFYDVRAVLAEGGLRLRMAPLPPEPERPRPAPETPCRRAGDVQR